MYCRKCGCLNSDQSAFCMSCGAPLKPIEQEAQQTVAFMGGEDLGVKPMKAKTSFIGMENGRVRIGGLELSKGAFFGILGGVIGAIALALALILIFAGRSWKGAVNAYYKAEEKINVKDAINVCTPPEVLSYYLAEKGVTRAQYRSALKTYQQFAKLEQSAGYSYSRPVKHKILYSVPLGYDEVDEIDSWFFDRFGTKRGYVTAAMDVAVLVTENYNGRLDTDTDEITVIKIGKNWYVYDRGFADVGSVLDLARSNSLLPGLDWDW